MQIPELHELLKAMKYSLALPEDLFCKSAPIFDLRRRYAEKSLKHACYAAAASRQTLEHLLEHPGCRFVDAANAVSEAGHPWLDPLPLCKVSEPEEEGGGDLAGLCLWGPACQGRN